VGRVHRNNFKADGTIRFGQSPRTTTGPVRAEAVREHALIFNVHYGKDLPDDRGTELPDRDAAHLEAIVSAGEMLRESRRKFLRGDVWQMHVTDEAGSTVCRLKLSAEDCD
jgi:hypothetical protein